MASDIKEMRIVRKNLRKKTVGSTTDRFPDAAITTQKCVIQSSEANFIPGYIRPGLQLHFDDKKTDPDTEQDLMEEEEKV